MRTIVTGLAGLLVAGLVSTAAAQTPGTQPAALAVPPDAIGEVDFGIRLTGISGDPARFQRLRDRDFVRRQAAIIRRGQHAE